MFLTDQKTVETSEDNRPKFLHVGDLTTACDSCNPRLFYQANETKFPISAFFVEKNWSRTNWRSAGPNRLGGIYAAVVEEFKEFN